MALAVPSSGFNLGLGKDIPGMGPFKNYQPKLHGPGSGRIKAVIYGANYVARYFRKNPRFGARIGAVAGGAAVNASRNKYGKALYPNFSKRNRFRSNSKYKANRRDSCKCHRCNICQRRC